LGRNHFKFPRKSIAIGSGITRAWRQQEVEGDTEEEKIIKMEKSMMRTVKVEGGGREVTAILVYCKYSPFLFAFFKDKKGGGIAR
jgi:hypothetical protein